MASCKCISSGMALAPTKKASVSSAAPRSMPLVRHARSAGIVSSPPAPSLRVAMTRGTPRSSAPMQLSALPTDTAPPSTVSSVNWAVLRKDLLEVMADPASPGKISEKGPTLVRLAWHSSGTYDKMTRTGGCRGTMRFKEELMHGANAGLDKPVAWMEPVKTLHPNATYADIYTLSGVVAVEAMGGPTIPWRAGRVDTMEPTGVTPDGRLPDADKGSPAKTAAALREVFGRMGFGDREIVALSGAHSLGRCHAEASGYVGPWTGTPEIFTNLYFKLLLKSKWTPDERYPKFQYKDPSGTLMMLPSDVVLTQDDAFKPFVELYAKEKETFYKDFAAAFEKLMELGTSNLVAV